MERVIWLCNLFLKCEIQILCSNWNPLRFQEKLSHFQHSLSPFISFFSSQICKFHCHYMFLTARPTWEKYFFFLWCSDLINILTNFVSVIVGQFHYGTKIVNYFFKYIKKKFPKSLSTKTRSPAPKKMFRKICRLTLKQTKFTILATEWVFPSWKST